MEVVATAVVVEPMFICCSIRTAAKALYCLGQGVPKVLDLLCMGFLGLLGQ